MSLPETHTVAEVAKHLGCSEWFVRDLVKRGVVQPLRLGTHARAPMRFTAEHLVAVNRALTPAAPPPRRRRRRAA